MQIAGHIHGRVHALQHGVGFPTSDKFDEVGIDIGTEESCGSTTGRTPWVPDPAHVRRACPVPPRPCWGACRAMVLKSIVSCSKAKSATEKLRVEFDPLIPSQIKHHHSLHSLLLNPPKNVSKGPAEAGERKTGERLELFTCGVSL